MKKGCSKEALGTLWVKNGLLGAGRVARHVEVLVCRPEDLNSDLTRQEERTNSRGLSSDAHNVCMTHTYLHLRT